MRISSANVASFALAAVDALAAMLTRARAAAQVRWCHPGIARSAISGTQGHGFQGFLPWPGSRLSRFALGRDDRRATSRPSRSVERREGRAASKARAARSTRASAPIGPTICRPIGRPGRGEAAGHRGRRLGGQVEGVAEGRPVGPGAAPFARRRHQLADLEGRQRQGGGDEQVVALVEADEGVVQLRPLQLRAEVVGDRDGAALGGGRDQRRVGQLAPAVAVGLQLVVHRRPPEGVPGGDGVAADVGVGLLDDGAEALEGPGRGGDGALHLGVNARGIAEPRRIGDAQAAHAGIEALAEVGRRARSRRRDRAHRARR